MKRQNKRSIYKKEQEEEDKCEEALQEMNDKEEKWETTGRTAGNKEQKWTRGVQNEETEDTQLIRRKKKKKKEEQGMWDAAVGKRGRIMERLNKEAKEEKESQLTNEDVLLDSF